MKIQAKTEYACKAILELSLHWPDNQPLSITSIARRQKIPLKFLTQILLHLKQLGMAESIRGKNGGYILKKAPQEITLYDVLGSLAELNFQQKDSKKYHAIDIFQEIWIQIDEVIIKRLQSITFDDLARKQKFLNQMPTYTI